MEPQLKRTKGELLTSVNNFDKYDITECLDILRYLQTFDSQDLRTERFQKIIQKLEARIMFLVNAA